MVHIIIVYCPHSLDCWLGKSGVSENSMILYIDSNEGKLEDAINQHFILFPQCFLPNYICIPLCHIKILMIILDRTKLKTERPSGPLSQSQCYSDYKSTTTLKA